MPPFFETINIADFILVLNRSLKNNIFLIYAGQWHDSTCQIFNQWNSIACLREPITKREKLLTITLRLFKKVINFVFSSFLLANLAFCAFVIVKNKLMSVFYVSVLLLMIKLHNNFVWIPTTLWQCCDVILSSKRGQTKNWRQFVLVMLGRAGFNPDRVGYSNYLTIVQSNCGLASN